MSSTHSGSKKTSYQAAAYNRLSLQPKDLGYTPFEYWKGPKPVLPGSKRTPGPIKTGRPTIIEVTALDTSSSPKAQQQLSSPLAPVYPDEKRQRYREKGASDQINMGWNSTYYGDGGAGPTTFQVRDHNGAVELVSGSPPSYDNAQLPARTMKPDSRWDPRGWRKRTWAGIALVLIVAIIVGVVAGVEVAKANRYPDYSKLTYSLEDTCKSTQAQRTHFSHSSLTLFQILGRTSSTTLTISKGTTRLRASCIMFPRPRPRHL